ncbi:hypothetical protein [Nocardiopsis coralliicola]
MARALLAPLTGAAIWLFFSILLGVGVPMVASLDQATSDVGAVLWFALPQLPVSYAMVALAALVYGRARLRSIPAALIVIAPVAVDMVMDIVLSISAGTQVSVLAVRALCFPVGAALAWWTVLPAQEENVFQMR